MNFHSNRLPFNRRQMLALAGAGLVTTIMPTRSRAQEDGDPVYFTWAGYDNPIFFQSYIDKNGSSPEVSFFVDEDEATLKLRSGFIADVGHPCASGLTLWRDAGLLRPIDKSRLEHWDEIFPTIRAIPGIEDDEGVWLVPFDWGNSALIVRTDLVDEADRGSLADILLNPKYKGRISLPDISIETAAIGGLLAGIDDPFNMSEDQIAVWRETMKQANENVLFYWSDPTTMEQSLVSGEIVAAWGWNFSVTSVAANGTPVAYLTELEGGAMTWVCGLSLLNATEAHNDKAYDLLNAFSSAESGKNLIEQYGFGAANQKSFELADPAAVQALGFSDAQAFIESGLFFSAMPGELRQRISVELEQIKAGQ